MDLTFFEYNKQVLGAHLFACYLKTILDYTGLALKPAYKQDPFALAAVLETPRRALNLPMFHLLNEATARAEPLSDLAQLVDPALLGISSLFERSFCEAFALSRNQALVESVVVPRAQNADLFARLAALSLREAHQLTYVLENNPFVREVVTLANVTPDFVENAGRLQQTLARLAELQRSGQVVAVLLTNSPGFTVTPLFEKYCPAHSFALLVADARKPHFFARDNAQPLEAEPGSAVLSGGGLASLCARLGRTDWRKVVLFDDSGLRTILRGLAIAPEMHWVWVGETREQVDQCLRGLKADVDTSRIEWARSFDDYVAGFSLS